MAAPGGSPQRFTGLPIDRYITITEATQVEVASQVYWPFPKYASPIRICVPGAGPASWYKKPTIEDYDPNYDTKTLRRVV